jgi:hypothetical protein
MPRAVEMVSRIGHRLGSLPRPLDLTVARRRATPGTDAVTRSDPPPHRPCDFAKFMRRGGLAATPAAGRSQPEVDGLDRLRFERHGRDGERWRPLGPRRPGSLRSTVRGFRGRVVFEPRGPVICRVKR